MDHALVFEVTAELHPIIDKINNPFYFYKAVSDMNSRRRKGNFGSVLN